MTTRGLGFWTSLQTSKHLLQLLKILNYMDLVQDWTLLNFTKTLTSRQTTFMSIRLSNLKVDSNLLCNCLCILNGRVKIDLLNKPYLSFKFACKKLFQRQRSRGNCFKTEFSWAHIKCMHSLLTQCNQVMIGGMKRPSLQL